MLPSAKWKYLNTISGKWKRQQNYIDMASNIDKKIDKILADWAKKVCEAYKTKLKDKNASGMLVDTADYGTKQEGNSTFAYLVLQDYWRYVEEGRSPGTYPPVDAIKEWIRQKNIIPQPYTIPSGKRVIPTENSLAFLIGRKIKEEGIPATNFLDTTIKQYDFELLTAIGKALKDEVIETLTFEFRE